MTIADEKQLITMAVYGTPLGYEYLCEDSEQSVPPIDLGMTPSNPMKDLVLAGDQQPSDNGTAHPDAPLSTAFEDWDGTNEIRLTELSKQMEQFPRKEVLTWEYQVEFPLGRPSLSKGTPPFSALPSAPSDVIAISCGFSYSAFLTASGEVFVSGMGDVGQCGLLSPEDLESGGNSSTRVLHPAPVFGTLIARGMSYTRNFVQLSCGGAHVLARTSQGQIYAWGLNLKGQVGCASTDPIIHHPTLVDCPQEFEYIACGSEQSAAISTQGQCWVWGSQITTDGSFVGKIKPELKAGLEEVTIVLVACGDRHALALNDRGIVFAWGDGSYGKLGLGHYTSVCTPTPLSFMYAPSSKSERYPFLPIPLMRLIACGQTHSAAVDQSGRLYTWGHGQFGALGHGRYGSRRYVAEGIRSGAEAVALDSQDGQQLYNEVVPRRVTVLAANRVSEVHCGFCYTLVRFVSGDVYACGDSNQAVSSHNHASSGEPPALVSETVNSRVIQARLSENSIYVTEEEVKMERKVTVLKRDEFIPKVLRGLLGRHVSQLACGGLHCMALTQPVGEVWSSISVEANRRLSYDILAERQEAEAEEEGNSSSPDNGEVDDDLESVSSESIDVVREVSPEKVDVSVNSAMNEWIGSSVQGPVDDYGFPVPVDALDIFIAGYAAGRKQELRLEKVWQKKIKRLRGQFPFVTSEAIAAQTKKLKRLIRGGIPRMYRGEIWMALSGARRRMMDNPGYYESILLEHAGESNEYTSQIGKDVGRTWPRHEQISQKEHVRKVENVLVAYSWKNPVCGYCQSMNMLASLLLLHLGEEESFWLLCTIVDHMLAGYYTVSMTDLRVDMLILRDLLKLYSPPLFLHLETLNVMPSLYATPWFLCIFATDLPIGTCMRVWDAFFLEGPRVIFRTALSLLKGAENNLLQIKDMSESQTILKKYCRQLYDADELMKQMKQVFYTQGDRLDDQLDVSRSRYLTVLMEGRFVGNKEASKVGVKPLVRRSVHSQRDKASSSKNVRFDEDVVVVPCEYVDSEEEEEEHGSIFPASSSFHDGDENFLTAPP